MAALFCCPMCRFDPIPWISLTLSVSAGPCCLCLQHLEDLLEVMTIKCGKEGKELPLPRVSQHYVTP